MYYINNVYLCYYIKIKHLNKYFYNVFMELGYIFTLI